MINTSERVLFGRVNDLARWIEHQYNIKMSVIGWMGRLKKIFIEQLFLVQNVDGGSRVREDTTV